MHGRQSAAAEGTSGCAAPGQRQGQTRGRGGTAAGRAAGPWAGVIGPGSRGRRGRNREGDMSHSPARRSCSSPWRPQVSAPGMPARHPLSATPPPRAAAWCGAHGRRHAGSAGEAAGTAGPGQTSAAAPQAPPRRSLTPSPAGRSGKGRSPREAGPGRGRGQSTAARGVPARPRPAPRAPRRFRCDHGGGCAASVEMESLTSRSSLVTRPTQGARPGGGNCVWKPSSAQQGFSRV